MLETLDVRARMDSLNRILIKELEVLELGSKIQSQVQSEVGKNQREYFLREQLKAIQKELGEDDDQQKEIDELREKIEAAGMPEAVQKEANRELERLSRMPVAAAEYTVSRTYLDWLVALPWNEADRRGDRPCARPSAILDERSLGPGQGEGPHPRVPGRAQAEPGDEGADPLLRRPSGRRQDVDGASRSRTSLGRKFVRVSLGGMRDEAEIRGHRRTYIGALPGQVIQGLRRAESKNPVFMLDEIDKLGSDFRGDPSSALLEVLDPEQNDTFRDHYLDVPFDLSEVLFITTANVLDPIPPALRDRMEVLELPGYTEEEKLQIAREHLVAKQVTNHGLTRRVAHVHRRRAARGDSRLHARGRRPQPRARDRRALPQGGAAAGRGQRGAARRSRREVVVEMLGAPRFLDEEMEERTKKPGVAIGLAWTPAGGDVLFIEASRMAGSGPLTLTGQLGDVMKESARAALSWIARARDASSASTPTSSRRRDPPPRALRRHSQGRAVGGRDDGDGAGRRS